MSGQITKKLSVLIVDDVELNREVLSIGLVDNYNVLHASNGREAIDIIESSNCYFIRWFSWAYRKSSRNGSFGLYI